MQIFELLTNETVQIVLVILTALLVQAFARKFIAQLIRRAVRSHKFESRAEERKREDTIIKILGRTAGVIVWLVAFVSILGILRVNIAGLLTGAGVVGVILGLGAQSTIKDYIAGIFILVENQYRVGDIVTLSGGSTGVGVSGSGTSGVVEDISLRITKLRDLEGTLHIVRNGEASIISNRTFKHSSVVIDVNVAYDADIDQIELAMNGVGAELAAEDKWKPEFVEPIQFLRVDKFADSAVVARAVGKVVPAAQWDIAGEYRRRLLRQFKEQGLTIALPQLVIRHDNQAEEKKHGEGRP